MDWNQAYLDTNTPWDKGTPSPVIVDLLGEIPLNANIVVPGCGTGNDIVALLQANPVSVIGIDIAPEAIGLLRKRFDGNPAVHPVLGDFFEHAAENPETADVIIEHTCFCAIPVAMRPAYAAACLNILRPGGKVVGVFYWMPRDTDDITIGPPFQTSDSELRDLFDSQFDLEISVATVGFPERLGRELRVVMTRRSFVNDGGSERSV